MFESEVDKYRDKLQLETVKYLTNKGNVGFLIFDAKHKKWHEILWLLNYKWKYAKLDGCKTRLPVD